MNWHCPRQRRKALTIAASIESRGDEIDVEYSSGEKNKNGNGFDSDENNDKKFTKWLYRELNLTKDSSAYLAIVQKLIPTRNRKEKNSITCKEKKLITRCISGKYTKM